MKPFRIFLISTAFLIPVLCQAQTLDYYGGLSDAPCKTSTRATTVNYGGLKTAPSTHGWEGGWHVSLLSVGGVSRWVLCDPMDNAFQTRGLQIPGYPSSISTTITTKYGASLSTYVKARSASMALWHVNTMGENNFTNNGADLWMGIPTTTAGSPLSGSGFVPQPGYWWGKITDVSGRRVNYNSAGANDNVLRHPIKQLMNSYSSIYAGQPYALPGQAVGAAVTWSFDIFDPQFDCGVAVYSTDGSATLPSQCPATNNYAKSMAYSSWPGGSLAGTTETLVDGGSSGVTSPGSHVVTPASMTGITTNTTLQINKGLSDAEIVKPASTTGTTFTATFAKTHSQGFKIQGGLDWVFAVTPDDSDTTGAMANPPSGFDTNFIHGGWAIMSSKPTIYDSINVQNYTSGGNFSTTTTQQVTHNASGQTVTVASTTNMSTGIPILIDAGTSHEEAIVLSAVGAGNVTGIFRLDHANGAAITPAYYGAYQTIFFMYGNSGVSFTAAKLTSSASAAAQCFTLSDVHNFSTSAPNNTATFDPGMSGYVAGVQEETLTVDGVGASGPVGCQGATQIHTTAGAAFAHASGSYVQSPLAQDTTNYSKLEIQNWMQTNAGSFDDLTSGSGYGTGDTGVCKLDQAWGLIESTYNCTTLTGWPLTYSSTLSGNITGSSISQSVAVVSSTGLVANRYVEVGVDSTNRELVKVLTVPDGTHFTGIVRKNHSTSDKVAAGGYAHWGTNNGWNRDPNQDPGAYFLDENGYHGWFNVAVISGDFDPYLLAPIGNTTITGSIAAGSNVTVSIADMNGFRDGMHAYLDPDNASKEQVALSGCTYDTLPAGHCTAATVAGSHSSGAVIRSQMYNDLDSYFEHYTDHYQGLVSQYVRTYWPGVLVNGPDHVDVPQESALKGFGGQADFIEVYPEFGTLCKVGWTFDQTYTYSSLPIVVYMRDTGQNDSEYRDLSTTSNDAVTSTGLHTVHLACADGAAPCNVVSGTYNITIDGDTANEEVVSAVLTAVAGAGNSTLAATFAKTHLVNFSIWGAIAHITDPFGYGDWDSPSMNSRGQAFYDFWLTGSKGAGCPTSCPNTSPITSPPWCPNFGPAPGTKALGDGTNSGAYWFKATLGDYPIIGYDKWEHYSIADSAASGLISLKDNIYNGVEDVTGTGTDPNGFTYGGETFNYGDAVTQMVAAHSQIDTNLINFLGGSTTSGMAGATIQGGTIQ